MSNKTQLCTYRPLTLLILSLLLLFLPNVDPSWAQTSNPISQSSWADIWQRIVRRRDQERPRTSRGLICPVVPQLAERRVIWRDRPIFVWKGKAETVSVSNFPQSKQTGWTQKKLENVNSVVYSGAPLKPGTRYLWKAEGGGKFSQVIFQTLEQPERDRVTAGLMQLETKLQQQKITAEAKVKQRVQVFLNQNLFLDAIQELYTVPQPSSELKILQQKIVQVSCPN
jgi:hypothetical protein